VQARRDERLLGHHPSRQELTVALLRRGRALPRWWLRRCGGESERRLSLLEAGVLADQLARGLGSFASLLRRGRLCLSLEDLTRLRVPIASLAAPSAPPELRRAISEQIVWARERLAVAFALPLDLGPRHAPWAGAWLRSVEARLRAVERAHFDVLSRDALPSPWALRAALLGGALNWLPPRSVTERPARG
jgi:hypothetical protein